MANSCYSCPYRRKCYLCDKDLCEPRGCKCKVNEHYLDRGLRFKICAECAGEEDKCTVTDAEKR